MDVQARLAALGIPRLPPFRDDVVAVIGWLPLRSEDGKPLTWTRTDACRLIFARWRYRTGKLNDDDVYP